MSNQMHDHVSGSPGPRGWTTAVLCSGLVLAASLSSAADESPNPSGSRDGLEAVQVSAADFASPDDQLQALIATALENQPSLHAARSRWQAQLEQAPQAASLPDPQLNYRWFASSPETRVGPQEHMLELSQSLPWAGKRDLRTRQATHMATGSAWAVRDLAGELVASVKRSYFEMAYLQEALTMNREEAELLRRFESIALTRYATGGGIQQNVIRVQTEVSRLHDQAIALRRRSEAEARRIARAAGRPDGDMALKPIMLQVPQLEIDSGLLEAMAVESHPRVVGMRAQVSADEALASSRSLAGRPDFKVGLGYTFVDRRDDAAGVLMPPEDNGKDILAVTVGINLPLQRRRIKAGIAEARLGVQARQQSVTSLQQDLRFRIQEAVLRFQASRERAELYREVVVPQAEASLDSAEAAYATSKIDIPNLLDAERVLFQVRLAYHRMVADTWLALTDIERHLGQPYPVLSENKASAAMEGTSHE